ncbi:MAG: CvpA family protein [Isosphaeraceae bacterium]|nr:CvpA family protein [Isosphaeraceae bacterium]
MGLDLALGGLVLLIGLRGWFKGFVLQAVRLAGLVACVYLADPVRNLAKPYVAGHLPSIQPNLVDRLLWWAAAFTTYFVLVGVATLLVKLSRRKTLGEPEPQYNDQFAGFLLGLIKGTAVAAALAAGFQTYALGYLKTVPWAERQAEGSRVLEWNTKYQPVAKFWSSRPVQHFVNHVQRMGLQSPDAASQAPESEPVAAANRPPQLSLPTTDAPAIDGDVARLVESIQAEVRKLEQPR